MSFPGPNCETLSFQLLIVTILKFSFLLSIYYLCVKHNKSYSVTGPIRRKEGTRVCGFAVMLGGDEEVRIDGHALCLPPFVLFPFLFSYSL